MRVSVADSPRHVLNGEFICQLEFDASQGEASVKLQETQGAVFFNFYAPSGLETLLADRVLPTESVNNFRDFGGYHTTDGKRVRWQHLYRSGHLGELNAVDQRLIADLRINVVCDFRTRHESEINPSKFATDHQPLVVPLALDPGDNWQFVEWFQSTMEPEELRRAVVQKMRDINRVLAIDKADVYRSMFQILLSRECPVLIHCSAGKDRTGFGAALILSALGVDRETIMHDYLLTNRTLDIERTCTWFSQQFGVDINPVAVQPILGVQSDYIQTAFDSIDKEFGNLDSYLKDAMALDSGAIEQLRDRYLEQGLH